LIRRYLGRECIGLRTPFGYYRGLLGRPDLLRIVADTGHRYVSSWGRNEDNGNPTPWVQPFDYAEDGFAGILELPFQFWLDGVWFDAHGYGEGRAFRRALEGAIDEVAERDLVFATAFHEWCAVAADEEGTGWIRGLLQHARRRGVEITTYTDYWARTTGAGAPAGAGQAAGPAPWSRHPTRDRDRRDRAPGGTTMDDLNTLRDSLLEGRLGRRAFLAKALGLGLSLPPPAPCSRPGAAAASVSPPRRPTRRRSAAACSSSRATSSRSRSAPSARPTTGRSGRS
jgi:hypothetical protein